MKEQPDEGRKDEGLDFSFPINLTSIGVECRPRPPELPRVVSSLVPKDPQVCLCLPGPCPHLLPRIQPQLADMPLSYRTQSRPSSPFCCRAAFVTRVLEQTSPRGHQASSRPGQVQTASLALRSRSIGAGRMPTAPVTTDHHLHPAEGPRQQAP